MGKKSGGYTFEETIDCGCFAIAWAVHLAYGDKPETIILDQTKLRSHLEACLLTQQFNPFPHTIKKTQHRRSQKLSIKLDWFHLAFLYLLYLFFCAALF